ncbi:DNA mismatch repair protein MutS [Halomicrobium zhouii]|uniref:DNA mismatch repair protein MutS n=1 Tax=Halomicrobium zhouii TaxID=767519 RepID=A0A1I6L4B1_9EURY|nr:DNA mismatch repair protein MutS [Halomicrobium zhouii]SFR98325.1 DNA mismatch repair protein MutS [Halomicrobium zhouii]
MDAALGPPEKMAENADELTPMMSQYFELCERYDDSLVLFQVGDFYEAFEAAAEKVARLCEITLTKREDSTGQYAMAGIPIDNAESYVETLLDAGYRVAVADQVEDPDEVSGVVERAVTRIITPGTLTEDALLRSPDNNYVAALTTDSRRFGLALLDVSTGDFYATSANDVDAIADEVGRFAPAEAIVGPNVAGATDADDVFGPACMVTPYDEHVFERDVAGERVGSYFGDPDSLLADDVEVRACGALLEYAEYTRGGQSGTADEIAETATGHGRLDYLNHLTRYDPREYMLLDAVALDSLELFERRSVRGHEGRTLVDTLDETACALGRRQLNDWIRRPLLDEERIEGRHAAVEELVGDVQTRERLRDLLTDVYDLERLISRVSRGRANARDLRSLAATLGVVPEVKAAIADAESDLLADLHETLDPLTAVREEIEHAIREDPPQEVTEGNVVKPGYDETLDDLRETERSGKQWIADLQADERERTGIESLKVDHHAVHGYYIEVTDANADLVPEDYQRRQTLKNAERYVTPELKDREDEIFRAEQRADDREYELFRQVRDDVAAESERVQALADRLATLDVLVAFGEVAANHDYCRPSVGGEAIDVEGGRHPVVERAEDSFVPNDARFTPDQRFAVITGPNMSGKSTYMRQVALTCVLAQAGSFVPARSAALPVVDRVFTRVGASDDIAGGRSTFMIEMTELADILSGATEDSLILLDEVGRGTSTADGLAIARAVTEHVHDEIGAYTLFATHHHELTAAADDLTGVFTLHFETRQVDGEVVFEHRVAPGAAAASYGVEVAKMAGIPDAVVDRSRTLLDDERAADSVSDAATVGGDPATNGHGVTSDQESADYGAKDEPDDQSPAAPTDDARLSKELRDLDVATMTPLEAMNALAELKERVDD